MGRFYAKARLIAEVETNSGGDVHLIGIDSSSLEHDIIQNGWGDAQGYEIGGKDYSQVLNLTGLFTEVGDYKITLKLIDRENSDSVISENTFNIKVSEESASDVNNNNDNNSNNNQNINDNNNSEVNNSIDDNNDVLPQSLPKTGANMYAQIGALLILFATLELIIIFKRK